MHAFVAALGLIRRRLCFSGKRGGEAFFVECRNDLYELRLGQAAFVEEHILKAGLQGQTRGVALGDADGA